MRLRSVLFIAGVVGCVGLGQAISQDGKSDKKAKPKASAQAAQPGELTEVPKITELKPMSFWMARKLDHTKSILESLTKADYEKLAKDAEQMQLLGKLEGFVRRKNEHYRQQLRTFEFANQELIRQAKRHNSEGAALAFNQLTNSCVACHVLLREGVD